MTTTIKATGKKLAAPKTGKPAAKTTKAPAAKKTITKAPEAENTPIAALIDATKTDTKPEAEVEAIKPPAIEFNAKSNPLKTGVYVVDRGAQGKMARHYSIETNSWSRCGETLEEALSLAGTPSAVNFFPWIGPFMINEKPPVELATGKNIDAAPKVKGSGKVKPTEAEKAKAKEDKAKASADAKAAKLAAKPAKVVAEKYPDGTIFYRADRQKWVAMAGGMQEAARPTIDACKNFLTKKYPNLKQVVVGDPTQGVKKAAPAVKAEPAAA